MEKNPCPSYINIGGKIFHCIYQEGHIHPETQEPDEHGYVGKTEQGKFLEIHWDD